MSVIDEKQEAVARIRMAIDNDEKARQNLEEIDNLDEEVLEPESRSPTTTWRLGSPEGKKRNLHVLASDFAATNPNYGSLDERLRNFLAYHMPKEAVQIHLEDDIYVSLNFLIFYCLFYPTFRFNDTSASPSGISQWKIGLRA